MSAVVDADDIPFAGGEHPVPKLLRSSHQDFGMNSAPSGGDFNTFPFVYSYQETVQLELVRWLHLKSRIVIPDPVALCMLKVPIEVVDTSRIV